MSAGQASCTQATGACIAAPYLRDCLFRCGEAASGAGQ